MTGGRIFDACADMGVAYASDRIRTPLGRRRPWVTVGMILFLPALWYVFVPGAHYSIARYASGLILFFLTWTIAFIPYLAQGTEIASGHDEKSRVNIAQSAVMLVAFLGSYILPFVLIDKSLQACAPASARASSASAPTGSARGCNVPPPPVSPATARSCG